MQAGVPDSVVGVLFPLGAIAGLIQGCQQLDSAARNPVRFGLGSTIVSLAERLPERRQVLWVQQVRPAKR